MIESGQMQQITRNKLAALMICHLLWGSVLWFSISNLGLGLSTDSVHLLFSGTNLAEGRGLISFDGSPVLLWPPLYPVLLADVHLLTGLSTFAAAHVLQALSFAGISVCLSLLFLRIFPDDFGLALAGSFLADIGVVVVVAFALVGSDYLHLFLVLLGVLLAGYYVENGSPRVYGALFTTAMLAMLQRYLGLAVIVMAALSILLFAKATFPRRLLRAGILLMAAVPAGVWYLKTAPLVSLRGPITFTENVRSFSQSLIAWFLPSGGLTKQPFLYFAILGVLVIALLVLLFWRRERARAVFVTPLLLFGLCYLLALFGSASVAYYNKLAGRFLLPLYVPFIGLLLEAAYLPLQALRATLPAVRLAGRVSAYAALGVLAVLLLRNSVPFIEISHAGQPGQGENVFNTVVWRNNQALQFWSSYQPPGDYVLFSNEPDGAAFYAQHSCSPSPKEYSGPYATEELPVASYASELFGSGRDVYLIWIDPSDRTYYYRPEDLTAIADVQVLQASQDGGVYRLRPKSGG